MSLQRIYRGLGACACVYVEFLTLLSGLLDEQVCVVCSWQPVITTSRDGANVFMTHCSSEGAAMVVHVRAYHVQAC